MKKETILSVLGLGAVIATLYAFGLISGGFGIVFGFVGAFIIYLYFE